MRKGDRKMLRLWFIFGSVYIFVAALIFLHHFLSFNAMWHWEEAMHHEAFFIATIWVAAAYLFVALVERIAARNKKRK